MVFEGIVSQDPEMLKIFDMVRKMSKIDATVLVQGESGTGKELIARAIHAQSPRANKSFVDINCAAVPETLLESELFGYEKGAFTGAVTGHKGFFEQAHGGTLFLDEIAEVQPGVQVKMLRALQERKIRPLGSNKETAVDIRIVSATNSDLQEAVRNKRFREDLFFRLNAITIKLPPLRERISDVPLLAKQFLAMACTEMGLSNVDIDPEVLHKLTRYTWPGNVRELQNMIVAAVCSCYMSDSSQPRDVRRIITLDDCPTLAEKVAKNPRKTRQTDVPFYEAREAFERDYLSSLLQRSNYNISAASKMGGISRKSIYTKAVRYGLIDKNAEDDTEEEGAQSEPSETSATSTC